MAVGGGWTDEEVGIGSLVEGDGLDEKLSLTRVEVGDVVGEGRGQRRDESLRLGPDSGSLVESETAEGRGVETGGVAFDEVREPDTALQGDE